MNEKIGALVKTSLVDFPGTVCAAVFLKHCNLRCPYCYNAQLVTKPQDDTGLFTLTEIKNHLIKRKDVLDGLVISGGEALLNPDTKELILFAKKLNYKIKLDTNGTMPELLQQITENPQTRPDFISMDIKTSPHKYHRLLNSSNIYDKTDYEQVLQKTIKILKKYPSASREFRTVLVPTLVQKEDIENIAAILPKDASWQFARFSAGNCLEPLYNALPPYSESQLSELINYAKTFIQNSCLR
ncbi:anaerobic ribonucleoside-triphosphate reductase activating protein [uncultured Treponema sp.]|uniref:anaerobic ribonucleoside-triphosphate reductase activating protein n=1 Tax=uncultured Treponema sp. TaxID=162155 RepID=UPI0025E02628|nr:anaerobic ribonucleoside-triphosphate reductase activating protein [uncultured Treponema sp.]